jgi:hypothetical protein
MLLASLLAFASAQTVTCPAATCGSSSELCLDVTATGNEITAMTMNDCGSGYRCSAPSLDYSLANQQLQTVTAGAGRWITTSQVMFKTLQAKCETIENARRNLLAGRECIYHH